MGVGVRVRVRGRVRDGVRVRVRVRVRVMVRARARVKSYGKGEPAFWNPMTTSGGRPVFLVTVRLSSGSSRWP